MQKPKPQIIVFGLLALALLLGFLMLPRSAGTACDEHYRRDGQLKIGQKVINVQIASTIAQEERGLSGRRCLGPDQGMLFVFDKPGFYPFWMKDMKFSIDIAWIGANGQVVDIQRNLKPSSYPRSYTNQVAAKKVLEVPAGRLDALDIHTGTKLN